MDQYDSAHTALHSPLHQATSPSAIATSSARRTDTLQDMQLYLQHLRLPRRPDIVIHVAGTKGKGSTLAYCDSLLRNHYNLRTGLFSSPHLVSVRERIRLHGSPISREEWGRSYWRVRRRLEERQTDGLPGYFRMLTLMALDVFCHQDPRLDVILWEVGVGGRYDATNVWEEEQETHGRNYYITSSGLLLTVPILVRGITVLDYDHTRVLGDTLDQIAWEKGGILLSNKLKRIGRRDGGYAAFYEKFQQWKSVIDHSNAMCNNENDDCQTSDNTHVCDDCNHCNSITYNNTDYHSQNNLTHDDSNNNNNNGDYSDYKNCVSPKYNNHYNTMTNKLSFSKVFVNGNNTSEVLKILEYIVQQESSLLQQQQNTKLILQVIQESYLEPYSPTAAPGNMGLLQGGKHQLSNAALAVAMCQYAVERYQKFLSTTSSSPCSTCSTMRQQFQVDSLQDALRKTVWPGRSHTISLPDSLIPPISGKGSSHSDRSILVSMNLRCDGAHTPISINACLDWFRSVITSNNNSAITTFSSWTCTPEAAPPPNQTKERATALATTYPTITTMPRSYKVLLFNCSHERNPIPLLYSLHQSNLFDLVYFSHVSVERPSALPKRLEEAWWREPLLGLTVDQEKDCNSSACFTNDKERQHADKSLSSALSLEDMWNVVVGSKHCCFSESESKSISHPSVSLSNWQETLANVWNIFHLYSCCLENKCQCFRGGTKKSLERVVNVTYGLGVKDAISKMKEDVAVMCLQNDHVDDGSCDGDDDDDDVTQGKIHVLMEVCITGSLYIVGDALAAVGWE